MRVPSPGLLVAAAVTWVAPIAVLVDRMSAESLPAKVPTQWNLTGNVDSWMPTQLAFVAAFVPGLAGAVLLTVIVLGAGDDISRVRGAAGLASGALLTSFIAFTWFSSVALAASGDLFIAGLVPPLLGGLAVAVAVFAGAAAPRRKRSATTP